MIEVSMLPEEERKHKLIEPHATEDALELYSLKLLTGNDLIAIEEHLLVCPLCCRNLDAIDHQISVLVEGLRDLEVQDRVTKLKEKRDSGTFIMFRRIQ